MHFVERLGGVNKVNVPYSFLNKYLVGETRSTKKKWQKTISFLLYRNLRDPSVNIYLLSILLIKR